MQKTDTLNCSNCRFLNKKVPGCNAGDYGSPLRKCLIGLLTEELEDLTQIQNILEVGCGAWSMVKDTVNKKGIEYFGVDPAEIDSTGKKSIRTHEGTASKLPFPDNTFDYLISNQTIEHWHEFGTSIYSGIAEALRVVKLGAYISINFPISFHGHYIFKDERAGSIEAIFPKKFFDEIQFTVRRKDSSPLSPYFHKGMNKPAYIGRLKARKIKSPSAFQVFLRYAINRNFHLINPAPCIRYAIKRQLGKTSLHKAPDS